MNWSQALDYCQTRFDDDYDHDNGNDDGDDDDDGVMVVMMVATVKMIMVMMVTMMMVRGGYLAEVTSAEEQAVVDSLIPQVTHYKYPPIIDIHPL